jgi:hypothetical protein
MKCKPLHYSFLFGFDFGSQAADLIGCLSALITGKRAIYSRLSRYADSTASEIWLRRSRK